MNCLHHVLKQTLGLGWNHHIQRLMVTGNFCLIAGIKPQEALRWYSEMYVDGYDWVNGAERHRHVALCRWRLHGDEALCRHQHLH